MVMPDDQPVDPDFDGDIMLCPHCLAENPENQNFCHKCATPLSSFAAIDPIGSIYAQVNTYQKAISPKTGRVAFIGVWLIFGPAAIASIVIILATLWHSVPPLDLVWYDLVGIVWCIVSIYFVYRVTRNYIAQSSAPRDEMDEEDTAPDKDSNIDPESDPQ